MKLVNTDLENIIDFNEDLFSIVIEDSDFLYKFVYELKYQIEGGDGKFVFSKDNREISLEDYAHIICSPFEIDTNSKRIQNLVIKKMLQFAQNDEHLSKFQEIEKEINSYFKDLVEEIDLPIQINTYDYDNLIKSINFSVEQNNSLIENLINYIDCLLQLTKIKLLILVNFKPFLNDEKGNEFIKYISYANLNVLFIDNVEFKGKIKTNKTLIIDKDRCEILKTNN